MVHIRPPRKGPSKRTYLSTFQSVVLLTLPFVVPCASSRPALASLSKRRCKKQERGSEMTGSKKTRGQSSSTTSRAAYVRQRPRVYACVCGFWRETIELPSRYCVEKIPKDWVTDLILPPPPSLPSFLLASRGRTKVWRCHFVGLRTGRKGRTASLALVGMRGVGVGDYEARAMKKESHRVWF